MNICGHPTRSGENCQRPIGRKGWCGTIGHPRRKMHRAGGSNEGDASGIAAEQAMTGGFEMFADTATEVEVLRCQAQDVLLGEFAEEWRPCDGVTDQMSVPVGRMGLLLRTAARRHPGDSDAPISDMTEFLSRADLDLGRLWPQESLAVVAWAEEWKEGTTPDDAKELGDDLETALGHARTAASHSQSMRKWWSDPVAVDTGRNERESGFRSRMLGHGTLAAQMFPVESSDDLFAQRVKMIVDASVERFDESDDEQKPVGRDALEGLLVKGCERLEGGEEDPVMREACAAALNWSAEWADEVTPNDLRELGKLMGDIVSHKHSNEFVIGTLRRRLEADGVPREQWHPVLLGSPA